MGSITVTTSVTLDGVVQGPGRPDEDTRGGFTHGGWGRGYDDEVMRREMATGMADRPLFVDRQHLSTEGARLFAEVVVDVVGGAAPGTFASAVVRLEGRAAVPPVAQV